MNGKAVGMFFYSSTSSRSFHADFASYSNMIRSCIGLKYMKASDILPDELLQEIQRFTEGCLIYIPTRQGIRRQWGDFTDTKAFIQNRNASMADDYRSGLTVREIAEKYHLAENTVKKIVYKK